MHWLEFDPQRDFHLLFLALVLPLVPGLFLAGEILDATGPIGGFNFQWAWATGRTAGEGAAKSFIAGATGQPLTVNPRA